MIHQQAWGKVPTDAVIQKTADALKTHGITPVVVNSIAEAKEKLLSLLPEGSEVMDMTSVSLTTLGITDTLHHSGKYTSIKNVLSKMDRATDHLDMQKLGAGPEYALGSVHAVTQDGKVVVASNTGSQLPAYAYGASHVVWVVGAQKITKNLDAAMKRIYEYVLPLESDRARKAYGAAGSNVSKLLIINNEINADRITMIIVKEPLGF
ncbi:MAG: LUD domain-containing protein [Candidatus Levybacteria bacterium]|nr:LUD domain-containing protein [Candidatus Levybacteria bacterium]